jgi:hypothetical protein
VKQRAASMSQLEIRHSSQLSLTVEASDSSGCSRMAAQRIVRRLSALRRPIRDTELSANH